MVRILGRHRGYIDTRGRDNRGYPYLANLMTATDWALMHVNDSAQYFAVRFSQVPDTAQGTLNITLKDDVALTPDNEDSLLAVTLPPPVPAATDAGNLPIIEKD